jgi:transcriptional regulator GlxA family with amidase domain
MQEPDTLMLSLEAQNIASQAVTHFLLGLSSSQQQALINPDQRWQRLQPALRYINTQLAEHIAIADLAAILACSSEHCIRLFKKMLRQTPTQYILTRRVEVAAELLISTQQDIGEIASTCGFPNRQYLSRIFKRHMGISPAKYRGMS